jgi:protein-tyrosine phosphatase
MPFGQLPDQDPVFRLLFVCTGNICRSAAAEHLARAAFARLGEAGRLVEVRSAGTRAVVGAPVHPDTAPFVRDLGGDPDGFTAQRLTAAMVREADLVLTMTRDHRRLALGLDPRALSRVYTLREAADILGSAVARPAGPEGDHRSLAQLMATGRAMRGSSSADDILDPIDQAPEVHRHVVETIAVSLVPLVDAVRRYFPDVDEAA